MVTIWHVMILLSFPQTAEAWNQAQKEHLQMSVQWQSAQASLIELLVGLCNDINMQIMRGGGNAESMTPKTTYFMYFGLYFYFSWCHPTFTLDQYLKLETP